MYATFRASDLSAKPWMIENRTAGARRLNDGAKPLDDCRGFLAHL